MVKKQKAKIENPPGWVADLFSERIRLFPGQIFEQGLALLVEWFQGKGITEDDATAISKGLSLQYLHNINQRGKGPRNSDIRQQLEGICRAAKAFRLALESASPEVKSGLHATLFRTHPPAEERKPRVILMSGMVEPSWIACGLVLPQGRDALVGIEVEASDWRSRTPKDKGGRASGKEDPTGRKAKEQLVLELRWLLSELGLNINSNKDMELAQVFKLVHMAATGQDELPAANIANVYASLARKLELDQMVF